MNFTDVVESKTDEELLIMVYEVDKWGPEMLNAVELELSNRDKLPQDIQVTRQQLIDQERLLLEKGKEASLFGQLLGWLTVFGIGGIFIGYNYAFAKRKSKYTADTYYEYNETARRNGKNMFFLSVLLSSLLIAYKFLTV